MLFWIACQQVRNCSFQVEFSNIILKVLAATMIALKTYLYSENVSQSLLSSPSPCLPVPALILQVRYPKMKLNGLLSSVIHCNLISSVITDYIIPLYLNL